MNMAQANGNLQVKLEPGLETYLQAEDVIEDETTTVIAVNEGVVAGDGTYYVDEQGRYYYTTSSAPTQNIVTIADSLDNNIVQGDTHDVLMDGHTMTVLQTEGVNGDVNLVLVVQEPDEETTIVGEQICKTNDINNITIYDFDDNDIIKTHISDEEEANTEVRNINNKRRVYFTCSYCSYASYRRYLLVRHMKSHSEDRPHKCSVCERGFKTLPSLLNHVNTHTGNKPHACKYCGNKFTTSGELVRHIRYRHTHEKPHKCTECGYASVELSKLRRHMRCHTGERPYQCQHCTYASPDTFKLKRHMRIHTGEKPYKCDICNMCFSQSNSLKNHKMVHNLDNKPVFACELCPATCGRKTDLRIHIQKLHTSDKPLKCKRCGKLFPDRYTYKMHNKTHDGEKCYKCELCPYASATKRHLASHMFKHTDEKPFKCELCDQAFRQKQLLKRHVNLYHDPSYVPTPPKEKSHECHGCKRAFAHKGNLIRHLSVHDPQVGGKDQDSALKVNHHKKIKPDKNVQFEQNYAVEEVQQEENGGIMNVSLSEEDLKHGRLVTDSTGKKYILLEVIQFGDGTKQVAVMATDVEPSMLSDPENAVDPIGDEKTSDPIPIITKIETDVDNCFGFGEQEDEAGELPEGYEHKVVLGLV